jgi:hypothetical protein
LNALLEWARPWVCVQPMRDIGKRSDRISKGSWQEPLSEDTRP